MALKGCLPRSQISYSHGAVRQSFILAWVVKGIILNCNNSHTYTYIIKKNNTLKQILLHILSKYYDTILTYILLSLLHPLEIISVFQVFSITPFKIGIRLVQSEI